MKIITPREQTQHPGDHEMAMVTKMRRPDLSPTEQDKVFPVSTNTFAFLERCSLSSYSPQKLIRSYTQSVRYNLFQSQSLGRDIAADVIRVISHWFSSYFLVSFFCPWCSSFFHISILKIILFRFSKPLLTLSSLRC